MSEYFIYYSASNIMGAIIFGIMLFHDRMSVDRQEKQLKYDNALIAFMLYFISDAIWAGVDSGVFPVNTFTVLATNIANCVIMTAITYTWLLYVLAVEQVEHRNRRSVRVIMFIPFLVSILAVIITFLVNPRLLIDENNKTTAIFNVMLVGMSYVYIAAIIVYAIRKAKKEENPAEKRKHLLIGFFPLMTVAGGLMQMILMPSLPIFCYSCTVLMLIFYIQSMEGQISTDPLTKLNNRGQLLRYVSQKNGLHIEGRTTYVIMMDINNFKAINDTYGHSEGDRALILVARALTRTVKNYNFPVFLGRYGGDEFVMVVHPQNVNELNTLISDVRADIRNECEQSDAPYIIAVGVGYDELSADGSDTFQRCQQRADVKLYDDKALCRINGDVTILK